MDSEPTAVNVVEAETVRVVSMMPQVVVVWGRKNKEG